VKATKAPAAKTAHARCALQSFAPLTPCSAYVACAVFAAAPLSPTRPHSTTRRRSPRCARRCDFRAPARSARGTAASHLPSLVSGPPRCSGPLTPSHRRFAAWRPLTGARHRLVQI